MDVEADLLSRAQEHDPAALGEIYDRYAVRLYRYIYSCVNNRETAEDLTAEVFLHMLEASNKTSFARTSVLSWLYRIAHNLVVDHYRRNRSRLTVAGQRPVPETLPADTLETTSQQEQVCRAVAGLTPEQQQVIVLRFGQRLRAVQVAELLGKSEEAVRALQRRALVNLRRVLEEE